MKKKIAIILIIWLIMIAEFLIYTNDINKRYEKQRAEREANDIKRWNSYFLPLEEEKVKKGDVFEAIDRAMIQNEGYARAEDKGRFVGIKFDEINLENPIVNNDITEDGLDLKDHNKNTEENVEKINENYENLLEIIEAADKEILYDIEIELDNKGEVYLMKIKKSEIATEQQNSINSNINSFNNSSNNSLNNSLNNNSNGNLNNSLNNNSNGNLNNSLNNNSNSNLNNSLNNYYNYNVVNQY